MAISLLFFTEISRWEVQDNLLLKIQGDLLPAD